MTKNVNFVAHARLKDIVGRGLINDDNVAIIELIKNAKDAQSESVDIWFANARRQTKNSMLVIQDTGTGMTSDDLQKKWLNIAYSEKKRSTPKSGGAYAGNKGIGRFACDRLGSSLSLFTKVRGGKLLRLDIDWTKFEVDEIDIEIGTIPATLSTVTFDEFEEATDGLQKFTKGTTLVIRDLRASWPKRRLIALRKELERFVIDPTKKFNVNMIAEDFPNDRDVNGAVENKIFEKLNFRTTSIAATVPPDGSEVVISLRHDGEQVFEIVEKNPYANLRNLKITIFFLNQPAKAFFNRQTGYQSLKFGSIFLFLNGFRVLPYGDESDDWLGLDRRKQQGARRFLGTRELVGHIEIEDQKETFVPVSSREGLVHNDPFFELTAQSQDVPSSIDGEKLYGLFHKVFRKLEKFVVDGLDWDRITEAVTEGEEERINDPDKVEYRTANRRIYETLVPTINIRTPKKHIKDFSINLPYVVRMAQEEVSAYETFFENLTTRFEGTTAAQLSPSDKRSITRMLKKQEKILASKSETAKRLEAKNAALARKTKATQDKLEVETKRRLFAEFESTADQKRILQMHHQISLISGKIYKDFDRTIRKYRERPDLYSAERLIKQIEGAVFDIDKIRKVAKFASKASFDLSSNKVNADLIQFVDEYIQEFNEVSYAWKMNVVFINNSNVELKRKFRPIELTMMIDNIIDNAGKASAKNVDIIVKKRASKVSLFFRDDGTGLSKNFKPDDLFHSGISTTEGSGIGLSHVAQIVRDLNGVVRITNNESRGATVRIDFESA